MRMVYIVLVDRRFLDVPEEKKDNKKSLLKFLLRKLNSGEVEASQDGGASCFQK